ncbi:hypothetical protein M3Y94_00531000 [Aphelenchoides besseyi]|nr:hypothetical protein M3Y94_00531000 [Aphelenchoides besseyi]KAI6225860.1 hypothetical protein M3Y95_00741700 [Aphelenchoides besseyi]
MSLNSVEDFVWSKIDESEYLKRVVEDGNFNSDVLLQQVKAIQSDLNVQLRKGVEENYPRLLEQVGAIESLNKLQIEFDEEMRSVNEKASEVSHIYRNNYEQLKSDTAALEQLIILSRILNDGIRCKQLVETWDKETFLLARAECAHELKLLCNENPSFALIGWMKDGFLKSVPEITTETSKMAIEELKQALISLNTPHVNNCLSALSLLFDADGCNQKIKVIIDNAIKEMDTLFLNLSVAKTTERASKHFPHLGNKLHNFLEQFQLLGVENAQKFSNAVASVMRQRMPADAEYAMRLVQVVSKCLIPHSDAVAKPIRDALGPLKASVLSQSLSKLFDLVNDTFMHDDTKTIVIVEKINAAMKAEISNVNWDPELQKQIEGNIAKALQMIGTKIESGLRFTPETLQLSGRVSKAQANNYQLLSVAHAFRRQWPFYSDCLRTVIEPHLKVIVDQMKATITVVLDSMHEEVHDSKNQGQVSLFMRELCDHIRVFRKHVAQIEPLAESLEALPNFINFVIEQFLLNCSLCRPITEATTRRFVNDLNFLCKSLQAFNCKTSKYLNMQKQFVDYLQNISSVSESHNIPYWLQLHLLISDSPALSLPHDSADWSRTEYIKWFNEHGDVERCQFLRNLVASFEHSNRSTTQSVSHLPRIKNILAQVSNQR